MSGQGCLDSQIRSLGVSDLTNHDDIWVLPEETSKGRCKGQANTGINLHLIDSGDLILNRIFNRNYINLCSRNLRQDRVEGGGFSAAGRATYQDNSMRPHQLTLQILQGITSESHLQK